MITLRRKFYVGGLTAALTVPASLSTIGFAQAQTAAPVEEVTVTGTSIRGVQPVGVNLISVGRLEIDNTAAQTVQDILKQVPALSNLGAASGQGNNLVPAIHNLGQVASYSTLVLIDGHRFSLGGQTQTLPDPGILPPGAIERVEVLADAASSTYGSDAVAGVINLVTRKDFSGFQASAQHGFGDHFNTLSFSAVAGATWNRGYIMATAAHSYRSPLFSRNRSYLNPDHRAQGGSNDDNNACDTATFQPGGAGGVFLGNAATTPIAAPACSQYPYSTVLSQDVRTNGMLKVGYDVSDRFKLTGDVNISDRHSKNPAARGTVNPSTAYMAGSVPAVNNATAAQDNPFYTANPAGYGGAATFEKVMWNADQLLSQLGVPSPYTTGNAVNWFAHGEAEYDITPTWRVTAMAMYGYEYDEQGNYNTLCSSCANLALNGTTNANGDPTLVPITTPISTVRVTNTPLTAANALDLWNPAASNRTSAATLRSLVDNNQLQSQVYSTTQVRLGTDAKILSLPGGDVSVAGGAEWVRYTLELNSAQPNSTGPSLYGASLLSIPLERHVSSLFGEVLIPIIGEGNALPFIKKLTLNGSARYDRYNDVGDTTNPKVGLDWQVVDDFKFRADFATSFVSPQLSSVGDRSRGGLNNFTCYGASCPGANVSSGTFSVLTASFPSVVGVPLSGGGNCTAAMASCTIAATSGTLTQGGPANPRPSKGESWSVGFDTSPSFIPGLTVSATLFNVRYIGVLTGTSLANALALPSQNLINFYPAGLNPTQVAALQSPYSQLRGSLPATTYYILSVRQANFNNVSVQGIDASVNYVLPTDNYGTFDVGGAFTEFLRFKQHASGGQAFYSILNTTGTNSTFGAVQTQARLHFGWEMDAFGADLYDNFIGSYRNWGGNTGGAGTAAIPLVKRADGAPLSGGDKVNAQHYFELNVRYNLPNDSFLGDALAGTQLYVDVTNLFDSAPAFYENGGSGYDASYTGDPTGRVVTVGVRVKL
jgi:iron complex outermembrane receptor protein